MSTKVWVLMKTENAKFPTWVNYQVVSKKSWQRAYAGETTGSVRYEMLAEGTAEAMLAYQRLIEEEP